MNDDSLYNIRMRASHDGKHVSGGERLVSFDGIMGTVSDLVRRAASRIPFPDDITVRVERLKGTSLQFIAALDVVSVLVPDFETGRAAVSHVLQLAGVSRLAIETAISLMGSGAAPSGSNMRGAMIMDAQTGERFEEDQERGVRVSRFDWTDAARTEESRILSSFGLTHFRTKEALALATKVVHAPGVIAELCWSDDPDYTAGYAASRAAGYVRFPFLKASGDTRGGRAIFVERNRFNLPSLLNYLEKQPVLIQTPGRCSELPDIQSFISIRNTYLSRSC